MASIPFSTLEFSDKLRAGGFTVLQAKAMSEAVDALTMELVSKRDLEIQLQLLEQRLTTKIGGMLAAAIVLVGGLVALF